MIACQRLLTFGEMQGDTEGLFLLYLSANVITDGSPHE